MKMKSASGYNPATSSQLLSDVEVVSADFPRAAAPAGTKGSEVIERPPSPSSCYQLVLYHGLCPFLNQWSQRHRDQQTGE